MKPDPQMAPHAGRPGPGRLVSLGLLLGVGCLPAAAQEPKVIITGGVQEDGSYRWVVTNHHKSPVVFIEFPHYHTDMFLAPGQWSKKSVNLVGVGADMSRGGTCTAWVDEPRDGIPRFGQAVFGMRIATAGARTGKGEVLVRFADGTSLTLTGVDLPTAPAVIERYAGLFGFAILIAIIAVLQVRRQRARRLAPEPASAAPDAEGQ